MMRLDELLDELPGVGLKLRNLFQTGEGWQANIASADDQTGYEFGCGETPLDALVSCLTKAGVNVTDE